MLFGVGAGGAVVGLGAVRGCGPLFVSFSDACCGLGLGMTCGQPSMPIGVLDGSLTTAQEIWEWDGTNAKMLLESGVIRKPGAMATFELTEGKLALTMTDGKVTGFTASGKGRWPTATGTAASLAGKSWTFKSWPTGAGQWEGEVTADAAAK